MATAVARELDGIRQSGGIWARVIAQVLETTRPTVSHWRSGRSTPRPGRDNMRHVGSLLVTTMSSSGSLLPGGSTL